VRANHSINLGNRTIAVGHPGRGYNGGPGWRGPYGGYHGGWVHGYWNGHHWPGGLGWGYPGYGWGGAGWGLGGLGLGLALGYGIGAWGIGSPLYNWGYASYSNPYYGYPSAPAVVAAPYDYGQPIDAQAPPPDQAVSDAATQAFAAAREAFKAGDYKQALTQSDQALKSMPNDASLHEFRALVLFALGQYEEAAAPLYAVLTNGPGWDWTTLASLYPNLDAYTTQLRALEDYARSHADRAAAHFVLGYHYLTQGHTDAAVAQLRRVSALQPGDKLSAQLVRQLTEADTVAQGTVPGAAAPTAPAPPPSESAPATSVPEGNLAGNWSASPSKDASIALAIKPDGTFTWTVNGKGPQRQYAGTSAFGNGILTLAPSQGPPMVGHVTWRDRDHFTFQVSGGPDDPGLTFARSG
jgi:hypothetical protein